MHLIEPYSANEEKIKKILSETTQFDQIPGIMGFIITSPEGLPIASTLSSEIDELKIAGLIAALVPSSENAIKEMEKGKMDYFYFKWTEGYFLAMMAGPDAILSVLTEKNARIGIILLVMRRICDKIAQII